MSSFTDSLQAQIDNLKAENKALRGKLDEWGFELAYFSKDKDQATPKGVKAFIEELIALQDELNK